MNNELKIAGLETLKNDVVDTLVLARDKFPGSSISLDALCKKYRIDNSKRTKHTALIDCDLLSKVYINLIDQKEPSLNFSEVNFEDKKKLKKENILYFKKIIKPNENEKLKHDQYLKNIFKKKFFN